MLGSALEHIVPEQMFNTDPNNYVEGFSSMKAIQKANEEGQKIFQITKENVDSILPQLQLSQVAKSDIENAARAGLTITTHEKRITLNGYTGEGYIILDERGDGAYLINGGLHGGMLAIAIGLGAIGSIYDKWNNQPTAIFHPQLQQMARTIFGLAVAALIVDLMIQVHDAIENFNNAITNAQRIAILANLAASMLISTFAFLATNYLISTIAVPLGGIVFVQAIVGGMIAAGMFYLAASLIESL